MSASSGMVTASTNQVTGRWPYQRLARPPDFLRMNSMSKPPRMACTAKARGLIVMEKLLTKSPHGSSVGGIVLRKSVTVGWLSLAFGDKSRRIPAVADLVSRPQFLRTSEERPQFGTIERATCGMSGRLALMSVLLERPDRS